MINEFKLEMKCDKVTEIGSVEDMLSAVLAYVRTGLELDLGKTLFGGDTVTLGVNLNLTRTVVNRYFNKIL